MSHRARRYWFLVVGGLAGCVGAPYDPSELAPVSPAVAPLQLHSGIPGRTRIVVRDSVSLAQLWPQIVGPVRPLPPLPHIDFARRVVIVATMGSKHTGGYAIHVDSLRIVLGQAEISITEHVPGNGCFVPEERTEPLAAVSVPLFNSRATFVEHVEHGSCP